MSRLKVYLHRFLTSTEHSYSEAIDRLYRTSVFYTKDPMSITRLTEILPQHRFCMIKAVEIDWFLLEKTPVHIDAKGEERFRMHEWEWCSVWRTLASLPSVRNLSVRLLISRGNEHEWKRTEVEVLHPMEHVVATESFELYIPWSSMITSKTCRLTTHDTFFEPRPSGV